MAVEHDASKRGAMQRATDFEPAETLVLTSPLRLRKTDATSTINQSAGISDVHTALTAPPPQPPPSGLPHAPVFPLYSSTHPRASATPTTIVRRDHFRSACDNERWLLGEEAKLERTVTANRRALKTKRNTNNYGFSNANDTTDHELGLLWRMITVLKHVRLKIVCRAYITGLETCEDHLCFVDHSYKTCNDHLTRFDDSSKRCAHHLRRVHGGFRNTTENIWF